MHKKVVRMIYKILSIVEIVIGAFLLSATDVILDLELSCGINNMPKESGIKLIILFIVAVAFIVNSIIFANKADKELV